MKTHPAPELLEPRIAPAGLVTVTVADGILKLVGDAEANLVSITAAPAGTVEITPTSGTQLSFNGTTSSSMISIMLPGPKLVAQLGDGNDSITLGGTFTSMAMDLGIGNDAASFGSIVVGGPVRITGGAGNDQVSIAAGVFTNFLGNVTLSMGAGDDFLDFAGFTNVFEGNLTVLGGAGGDSLLFKNISTVGRNLSVNLGAGAGLVTADGSTMLVVGKTNITGQTGPSEVLLANLAPDKLVLQGGLSFVGGAGPDSLVMTPVDKAEIGTAIVMRGGNGSDQFTLNSSLTTVGGSVNAQSSGSLAFTLVGPQGLNVEGSVNAKSSGSLSFFTVGIGSIAGGISVTAKTGTAPLIGGGIRVGKNVSVNFSAATAPVVINLTSIQVEGSVSLTGGSGNDTISVDEARIAGKLTINAGRGNDTVNLERGALAGSGSFLVGPVKINLGAGNDGLLIGDTVLPQPFHVFSKALFIGGAGADTLSQASSGPLYFAGRSTTGIETGV